MRWMFFLLIVFYCSCVSNIFRGKQAPVNNEPINELFLLLPDSAFYVNSQMTPLSKEIRQQILGAKIRDKAVFFKYPFVLDTVNMEIDFLKFYTLGDGEHKEIFLKVWPWKKNTKIIGINITTESMCCTFSKVKFYHFNNQSFNNMTNLIFPDLTIKEFIPQIKPELESELPNPIDLVVKFFHDKDYLEITVDMTPMIYDLSEELQGVDKRIKLKLTNSRFEIVK